MKTKEKIEDAVIVSEVKKSQRKTREQILREKIVVCLAYDESGVLIEKILHDNSVVLEGIDWTKGIFPYWLIATMDDDCVGCVQTLPGKPFGMIEFLYVDPNASFKVRAIVAQKLILQAMQSLYQLGCEYSMSMVDSENTKFYEIISKYALKVGDGAFFVKRFTAD